MIVEDLMQHSNDDLAARTLAAFSKLALWLLRDARDSRLLLDSFAFWIPWMLELGRSRVGRESVTVLFRYMCEVIDPRHLEELRAKIQTLGPRIERIAMTIADHFREEGLKQGQKKGLKQGLEKGLKKGLKQGRIDTLRGLLVLKFQQLGPEHEARLQAATPAMIDRYLRRLLTADSLVAVFAD
ncbi:MAG TPA: hypothetical protein VHN14_32925 [Kofleriaceae bacterium]|nr:hypothetical protein [Kofleriaceae bacterium]